MERTKQQVRRRRDPESKASLTMLIRIMEFPGVLVLTHQGRNCLTAALPALSRQVPK
jgi:hypothetical protein